jgi:hypothetical protein
VAVVWALLRQWITGIVTCHYQFITPPFTFLVTPHSGNAMIGIAECTPESG